MHPPTPEPRRIRLVAVDLDGTLLDSRKRVTPATVTAIRTAADGGVRVVLASARPPRSVRAVYRSLGLDTVQINYNGALVWDEPAGRPLLHKPMAGDLVAELIAAARAWAPEVTVSCEVMDRWFTDRPDGVHTTETGRLFKPDVIAPLHTFAGRPTTKLMFLGERSLMDELGTVLTDRFAGRASVLHADENLLQLMVPDAGKSAALAWVADHYGVALADVMAIGDAANDVGMLQLAGVAVAMGNAKPVVKAVADWVAPDNDAGGVAAAFARFGVGDADGRGRFG